MVDFGWAYPPGAERDPRAPWNQPDVLTHEGECPECTGQLWVCYCETAEECRALGPDDAHPRCRTCKGTGRVEVECPGHLDCEVCGCRCRECDPDGYNDRRND
jgi:hypothetical protein